MVNQFTMYNVRCVLGGLNGIKSEGQRSFFLR